MEYSPERIVFNRELSNLDELVLQFAEIMHQQKINYVIISGYIAILFGRARNTIDVDLFIEKINNETMKRWWNELYSNDFECINAADPDDALEGLQEGIALRFCQKGKPEPNFEIKFANSEYNQYSLRKKVLVLLKGKPLYTSEIELQIAYKIYLGSDKDYEDARHLFTLFKEKIDMNLLSYHLQELGVKKKAERVL